jgi:hypothetical protein
VKLRPLYVVVSSDGDFYIANTKREADQYRGQARKRWPEHAHRVVKYVPVTEMPGKESEGT